MQTQELLWVKSKHIITILSFKAQFLYASSQKKKKKKPAIKILKDCLGSKDKVNSVHALISLMTIINSFIKVVNDRSKQKCSCMSKLLIQLLTYGVKLLKLIWILSHFWIGLYILGLYIPLDHKHLKNEKKTLGVKVDDQHNFWLHASKTIKIKPISSTTIYYHHHFIKIEPINVKIVRRTESHN